MTLGNGVLSDITILIICNDKDSLGLVGRWIYCYNIIQTNVQNLLQFDVFDNNRYSAVLILVDSNKNELVSKKTDSGILRMLHIVSLIRIHLWHIPIILHSSTEDYFVNCILGLGFGADDCFSEEYSDEECAARINSIIRRYLSSNIYQKIL